MQHDHGSLWSYLFTSLCLLSGKAVPRPPIGAGLCRMHMNFAPTRMYKPTTLTSGDEFRMNG